MREERKFRYAFEVELQIGIGREFFKTQKDFAIEEGDSVVEALKKLEERIKKEWATDRGLYKAKILSITLW